jgi:hypothetical protein
LVGDRDTGIFSYAWRLGTGGTSFYIKPVEAALSQFKISLHGVDHRPGIRPGFKVELDESAESAVADAGGALVARDRWSGRQWFQGEVVAPGVNHVMRIRTTWVMFNRRYPSAPAPQNLKSRSFGGVIPAPRSLRAVDVDLFVCQRRPYWPNEKRARRDNACLGPLSNKSGASLTAVATHRSIVNEPDPPGLNGPVPVDEADRLRGFGATFDPRGFLWVCEQWLSRAALSEEAQTPGGE